MISTNITTTENMEWGRSLAKLIEPLSPCERVNWRNAAITSVTDDSRRVIRGSLFVAVEGEKSDGHDFISDAVKRNAAAVLCQRLPDDEVSCPVIRVRDTRYALSCVAAGFYGTERSGLTVFGVTGTDGKTTTTYLIRAILEAAGAGTGLLGTLDYCLGARSAGSVQTTPHPLLLHSMLREMRRSGLSHAVMEVSSHGLVHRRTAHVPFDIAVLTNVTEDHLDFHGTIEEYIRAKGLLFRQLDADSVAILNAGCPAWKRYARATRANVLTYGIGDCIADIKAVRRVRSVDGTVMEVQTPLENYEVKTSLAGDFNCENILAAAAAGFAAGIDGSVISRAVEKFAGVPGRLEKVTGERAWNMPTFFVDYAHTPDALRKIIHTLRPIAKGQLICVFGCGGERERRKRAAMGSIATSMADVTVITSDNSRGERTEDIIADITGGIKKAAGRYLTEPDRRRAIEKALEIANSADDVIVVCGKGAERFQQIGDNKMPFDDRDVCRQVMERMVSGRRKTA